jgi:hypothetical protein
VNLEKLDLSYNNFTGSLEFTKNMSKLEELDISETNLTTGLEYLSLSLEEISCDGKIREELNLYNNNLSLRREINLELIKKTGKESVVLNCYEGIKPEKITTTPRFLQKELTKNITPQGNYNLNLNYSDFLLRDSRPFS